MEITENNNVYDTANDEFIDCDPKKPVDCICPRCRCVHTMQIHWIGNNTPWKYCKRCKSLTEGEF